MFGSLLLLGRFLNSVFLSRWSLKMMWCFNRETRLMLILILILTLEGLEIREMVKRKNLLVLVLIYMR